MADRAALIATVRAAFVPARAAADSVSDASLRAEIENATTQLEKSITDWAGPLQNRIGTDATHDEAWWIGVGQDLLAQIGRYVRDNSSFVAQWSTLARVVGTGAQWAADQVSAAIGWAQDKVAGLRADLDTLKGQADNLNTQLDDFTAAADTLSDADHDQLYGAAAHSAATNLARLDSLVSGLESGLSLIGAGGARPVKVGDDWTIEDGTATPVSGLGNPFLALGAGGVIAVIAICTSLIVALYEYYKHANEVLHAQTVDHGLDLVKAGKLTPEQLKAILDAYNASNNPTSPWITFFKWLGGAAAVSGLAYGGYKLHQRSQLAQTRRRA
jgi:hypothetical protein